MEIFHGDGAEIRVIVVNPGNKRAALYFGGNGESVVYNAPELSNILPSVTFYLVNYCGYCGSGGRPTESGIYSDALHIFDAIGERHTSTAVVGRNLGSAVATYLAVNRDVERLVLITPIDSVVNVAAEALPVYPVSLLVRDRYDSVSSAFTLKRWF